MTDFKIAGIVSAVGLGLGYLLGGRSSQVMEAEEKPKLTPTQLKYLNMMKSNYDGYAYVEVDNRGWKPYKTRPVQQLLNKKIISIPKDRNNRFIGRVENYKAYNVVINPIALKYAYKNPFDGFHSEDKFAQYMAKQQPSSQNSSSPSVQGDYAITYLESHDDAKNQHKYYLLLTSGNDNYTAYGRLPGYGRDATMKLDKQPSASKMNELVMKKMKTYQLVGNKYEKIPSEIRTKLESEIGMKSSSPPVKPAGMNARQRIFMERRGIKKAEGNDTDGYGGENSEKINLTVKELLALILVNRDWKDNDWETDEEGQLNASFYHDDVDMKKMRGVLSSLVQKGIISVQEQYVNRNKYTMVFVNNKYTTGVDDYEESINWDMFGCKQEPVLNMGYENFIEWAESIPESIVKGMMDAKFSAESFEEGIDGELMAAEYQPDQELGDYSVSEIAKSSAIEGYQPNKYSFGPISLGAESVSPLKLKKDSCCCGATKKTPCVCMVLGSDCSAKKPMCACYRLKAIQEKDKKGAETFEADMDVGKEMLRQLGGRRFMMMVGAKQPIWDGDKNELHMKIGRNSIGANYFVIRLNPRDLYDLRFESRRMNRKTYEMSIKVKAEYDDVYADQLQDIFEQATGLYVRMAESHDSDSMPVIDLKNKTDAFKWIKEEGQHIKTDADREMEGVDYAAMTYHPEELEAGAINSLKAGDFEAAELFVKALNRQNFINQFQAEENR